MCSTLSQEGRMETPLTPLEFARRSRKLYGHREGVVDGSLRLTYEQFFERCDRWSAALQAMGVRKGDRVAYIAPNTHEQLESFYAVPQTGAVLVPINYRLTADDFVYITSHSGAKVLCVHPDYLDVVDGVRGRLTGVEQFISLGSAGGRKGWQEYESLLAKSGPRFDRPDIAENDLLALNYTSGTTARPKGVMITHRNAWMNVMDTLVHFHITVDDTYLWTLPMFHANGWTFVWIITAAGGRHICLPKVEPARVFDLVRSEQVGWLCAAPTVLISLANAPASARGDVPKGVQVITAGAPPAAATIERLEGEGVLLRHPAVQEAAIVGLPHEKWGEAPFAFVVLKSGATATERELINYTRERLAHFKAPHGVTFVNELPKTATGKIQKFVLRKGAAAIVRQ